MSRWNPRAAQLMALVLLVASGPRITQAEEKAQMVRLSKLVIDESQLETQ